MPVVADAQAAFAGLRTGELDFVTRNLPAPLVGQIEEAEDLAVIRGSRMRVADLVAEPLAIAGVARRERTGRAAEALEVLGLQPAADFLHRRPGSLSGGQRQRVALARTLVAAPELILADEPASMLDASLRATVTAQILEVQRALGATLVFITHDLALARRVADRIVVLEEGRIIEDGPTDQILTDPAQEETQVLLVAEILTEVADGQSELIFVGG